MDKQITWEKTNFHDLLDINFGNNIREISEEDFFEFEEDDDETGDIMHQMIAIPKMPEKIYHFNPYLYTTPYIMRTNFNIIEELQTLNEIDGVELIRPITKYCCIVCIGDLFDPVYVRSTIEAILLNRGLPEVYIKQIEDIDIRGRAIDKFNEICHNRYWCMYIFPNGRIYGCYAKNIEEFTNIVTECISLQEESGGTLFYDTGYLEMEEHDTGNPEDISLTITPT